MHTTEDIAFVDRIRSGDQSALKALYAQHFTSLVRVATHLCDDTAQARDAVQQAFITLWLKRETIQIGISPGAYLRRMVINEALAQKRKTDRRASLQQRLPQAHVTHTDVEDALAQKEVQEAIRSAIDALPERCGEIFRLSRYSEMTYAEIAEALEISVKTVENQMGKALKILRESLKGYL